jgi:hypothetical protein
MFADTEPEIANVSSGTSSDKAGDTEEKLGGSNKLGKFAPS